MRGSKNTIEARNKACGWARSYFRPLTVFVGLWRKGNFSKIVWEQIFVDFLRCTSCNEGLIERNRVFDKCSICVPKGLNRMVELQFYLHAAPVLVSRHSVHLVHNEAVILTITWRLTRCNFLLVSWKQSLNALPQHTAQPKLEYYLFHVMRRELFFTHVIHQGVIAQEFCDFSLQGFLWSGVGCVQLHKRESRLLSKRSKTYEHPGNFTLSLLPQTRFIPTISRVQSQKNSIFGRNSMLHWYFLICPANLNLSKIAAFLSHLANNSCCGRFANSWWTRQ